MKEQNEVKDENSWLDESALEPSAPPADEKADGHVRKSRDVKKPKRRVETESDYNRMRRVLMFTAAAAVVVGVGAILFSSWQLLEARSLSSANEAEMKTVLVASRSILAGDAIYEGDLVEAKVPKAYVPAGALEGDDAQDMVGKHAVVNLSEGLPVAASAIRGSAQPSDLATAIDGDDMVAYGVSVDDTTGMSPLLTVGDHVNVIAKNDGGMTVLVSDVRVLALNGSLEGRVDEGYNRVVLEVTQEQATAIAGAEDVSLSLLPTVEEAE